jgi:hypothetical protein
VPRGTPMQGVVGRWADVCFSAGEESSEAGLRELIAEAAEDTLDDNDAWADGYEFPERYLESDVKLLEASALDFEVMLRRRHRQLAPDRLSLELVSRLCTDNPEMMIMIDLAVWPVAWEPTGLFFLRLLPK